MALKVKVEQTYIMTHAAWCLMQQKMELIPENVFANSWLVASRSVHKTARRRRRKSVISP